MLGITDEFFWNAAVRIYKSRFTPPQFDDNGDEIFDEIYNGKCSYQYGGNGSVGPQGYTIQEAPDMYLPTTDIIIPINSRCDIKNGWELLEYVQVEKASPNFHFGATEIFLNHATREQ